MTRFLNKSLLAVVLGLGVLTATMPAASAANIELSIEQVGYRNGFYQVDNRGWGRDRWDRRPGEWGRRGGGRCDLGFAVAKARDFGLRRARVTDVTPRKVVVDGFRRDGYGRIVFANDRHCPVLWR